MNKKFITTQKVNLFAKRCNYKTNSSDISIKFDDFGFLYLLNLMTVLATLKVFNSDWPTPSADSGSESATTSRISSSRKTPFSVC